jgi:hypothetical protein
LAPASREQEGRDQVRWRNPAWLKVVLGSFKVMAVQLALGNTAHLERALSPRILKILSAKAAKAVLLMPGEETLNRSKVFCRRKIP